MLEPQRLFRSVCVHSLRLQAHQRTKYCCSRANWQTSQGLASWQGAATEAAELLASRQGAVNNTALGAAAILLLPRRQQSTHSTHKSSSFMLYTRTLKLQLVSLASALRTVSTPSFDTNVLSSRSSSIVPGSDRDSIISEWRSLMNMDVEELEEWLKTRESNSCGQKDDDGEAKGHKSGRCALAQNPVINHQ